MTVYDSFADRVSQNNEGQYLIVPPELLTEFPVCIKSDEICSRRCFKGTAWCKGGCGGSYNPSLVGYDLSKTRIEELKTQIHKKACWVAAPHFMVLGVASLMYTLSTKFHVKPSSLRIETAPEDFLPTSSLASILPAEIPKVWGGAKPKDLWMEKYPHKVGIKSIVRATSVSEVWFGVETGDDRLRSKYGKRCSSAQIAEATDFAHSLGLVVGWYLVVSSLDTPATLKATTELAAKSTPDRVYVSELDDGFHHQTTKATANGLRNVLAGLDGWVDLRISLRTHEGEE